MQECSDCRSDLEQIQFLLPAMAALTVEHIPADRLVDYKLSAKSTSPSEFAGRAYGEMEEHLELCDQCRAELEKLELLEEESPAARQSSKRFWLFPSRRIWYAVAAAAALILFLWPNLFLPVRSQGPMIAVLPFEYKGPAEKEFYTEGIPNGISTRLAKVSALGVISPSSTSRYKNTA
ncbi:MAG TPA: hypothetical protein VFR89_07655, partial [candidate division Zixibacteria bacterium]|nr:hypothetical protein [candidate division Zixibacteria bacterium]